MPLIKKKQDSENFYTLSGDSLNPTSSIDPSGGNHKNNKRFGCLMGGCLILILLFIGGLVGSGIYLYNLTDQKIGSLIISSLGDSNVRDGVFEAIKIKYKKDLKKQQILKDFIYALLKQHELASDDNKKKIEAYLFISIKKAWKDSKHFEKHPPKEFLELLQLIKFKEFQFDSINLKQRKNTIDIPQSQNQNDSNTTQKNNPFDFGKPSQNQNTTSNSQNNTVPSSPTPQTPTSQPNPNNPYDF